MKKMIFLVLVILLSFQLWSAPNYGILDDAKCLENTQLQLGFLSCTNFMVFYDRWTFPSVPEKYHFQDEWGFGLLGYKSSHVGILLSNIYLGFTSRYGLKKGSELSFNFYFYSPYFDRNGLYGFGPGITVDFGFKKNIFSNEKVAFSYKINSGIDYNTNPGIDIVFKNSLMLGTNNKYNNITGIISLQNSIDLLKLSLALATVTPGLELVYSYSAPKGFTFSTGLYIRYETRVEITQLFGNPVPEYQDKYYTDYRRAESYLDIGLNLSWSARLKTETEKN